MNTNIVNRYLDYLLQVCYANTMHKLKALRRKKALNQREIAKLAGISPTTYNRIEQEIQSPKLITRRLIARALGVNPEDIKWKD